MSTEPTSMMEIPQYLIYVVVPLSALLVLLYTVRDFQRALKPGREGNGQ
jgi:TRAP-type C4-dicarboxylate transport system permease small subunit